ncbi:YciI family protein [Tahibacter amnicola]|uniref:YciI family protein n=1 Tax=Tahibacter amnicola TaxID=2976241 RepID=A0ABY6BJS3_9GAMM|nr:YciI family protein [Tahibacter amnicola]UXI70139.1 YciI family protein [Tahibacter amnicola]
MQYMLLIYSEESAWANLSPADITQVLEAYRAYSRELAEAGVLRGGSELAPTATATTVRVRNGKPLLTDGPFAETREQLGGYYLIDVPSLDEATRWAARIPSATMGSIEVRPLTENQANAQV